MRRQVWSAMLVVMLLAPVNSYGAEAKEATGKKGEAMKMSNVRLVQLRPVKHSLLLPPSFCVNRLLRSW